LEQGGCDLNKVCVGGTRWVWYEQGGCILTDVIFYSTANGWDVTGSRFKWNAVAAKHCIQHVRVLTEQRLVM